MAYLKGPITRTQLKELNALAGAEIKTRAAIRDENDAQPVVQSEPTKIEGSVTRPAATSGMGEYFLPNDLTVARALKEESRDPTGIMTLGLVYRPTLLAQATARILDGKPWLDVYHTMSVRVLDPDRRGGVRGENHRHEPVSWDDNDEVHRESLHASRFTVWQNFKLEPSQNHKQF